MAEQEEKAPDAEKPASGKAGKGLVVVVLLVAVVLGGGAAAAGAIVAMRFAAPPGDAAHPPPSSSADDKVPLTVEFAPLVVDIRTADGVMHHLKVALSAEVPPEVTVDEVKSAMPRGRQAAISYLRGIDFDEAVKPEAFQAFQADLSKHVIAAMGPKRVSAILVTDFISQ